MIVLKRPREVDDSEGSGISAERPAERTLRILISAERPAKASPERLACIPSAYEASAALAVGEQVTERLWTRPPCQKI